MIHVHSTWSFIFGHNERLRFVLRLDDHDFQTPPAGIVYTTLPSCMY